MCAVATTERVMLVGVFATFLVCVVMIVDYIVGGDFFGSLDSVLLVCSQCVVYEHARRAIKTLKQENALLKSAGSVASTPPEDE